MLQIDEVIIIIIIIIISLLKTHIRRTCLHSKNITSHVALRVAVWFFF